MNYRNIESPHLGRSKAKIPPPKEQREDLGAKRIIRAAQTVYRDKNISPARQETSIYRIQV